MENNKFIARQFVPKTETRIILEQKEPTRLTKLATFLGVSVVENCGDKPCACTSSSSGSSVVSSFGISQPQAVATAIKASNEVASKHGGTTVVSPGSGGSVNVTYVPPKK